MKTLSLRTLLLFSSILFATVVEAQTAGDVQYDDKQQTNRDDMEALRRWLRDKRLVSVKEIGGDLSISGEVRVEGQFINEAKNYNTLPPNAVGGLTVDLDKWLNQRGANGSNEADAIAAKMTSDKAELAWDVEFNLMLDYRTDRTWAAVKIEFDNDMGVRSGTVNKIRLEKAYLGGRLIAGDSFTWDAEIGRRNLINVFDSKLEFGALFDGLLTRFSKAWPSIGDFYFNAGAFLVDDKTNHYGYVGELGAIKIANTGMNLKFSAIDWQKHFSTPTQDDRYRFLVAQLLAYYQFTPAWTGTRLVKFYAAALNNTIARPLNETKTFASQTDSDEKLNWGWYAGMSMGVIKRAGDWAIDVNYQWVQAQAVPDFDSSGAGLGNAAGVGFYTVNIDGGGGPNTLANATGNNNYHGFAIEALYAFTSNLTFQQNFTWTRRLDAIGPNHRYKLYEAEFIYAF
jgi:hypothetical protein